MNTNAKPTKQLAQSNWKVRRDTLKRELEHDKNDSDLARMDELSIDNAESALKMCRQLVASELQIAAHNRQHPMQPEAQVTDLRREMCGGPD